MEVVAYQPHAGTVVANAYHDWIEAGDAPGELAGYWSVDVGPLNSSVVLWSYADANAQQAAAPRRDPMAKRTRRHRRLHVHADLGAGPLQRPAHTRHAAGAIYEIRIYDYESGSIGTVIDRWAGSVDVRRQISPLIGCYSGSDGVVDKWVHIWPYRTAPSETPQERPPRSGESGHPRPASGSSTKRTCSSCPRPFHRCTEPRSRRCRLDPGGQNQFEAQGLPCGRTELVQCHPIDLGNDRPVVEAIVIVENLTADLPTRRDLADLDTARHRGPRFRSRSVRGARSRRRRRLAPCTLVQSPVHLCFGERRDVRDARRVSDPSKCGVAHHDRKGPRIRGDRWRWQQRSATSRPISAAASSALELSSAAARCSHSSIRLESTCRTSSPNHSVMSTRSSALYILGHVAHESAIDVGQIPEDHTF